DDIRRALGAMHGPHRRMGCERGGRHSESERRHDPSEISMHGCYRHCLVDLQILSASRAVTSARCGRRAHGAASGRTETLVTTIGVTGACPGMGPLSPTGTSAMRSTTSIPATTWPNTA